MGRAAFVSLYLRFYRWSTNSNRAVPSVIALVSFHKVLLLEEICCEKQSSIREKQCPLRGVYGLSSVEEVLGLYVACHLREELLDQRIGHIECTPQDSVRSFL